ncbi:MAG: hypothetical protein IPK33_12735 [Gemmatimonadetes bacterium]|nr:hypothetical protein [Gemmatimonadota bacterium]
MAGTALLWSVASVGFFKIKLAIAAMLRSPNVRSRFLALAVFGTAVRGALSGIVSSQASFSSQDAAVRSSLRAPDMARWGAIGAVVLPAVTVALAISGFSDALPARIAVLTLLQNSLVGATFGFGSLALARRADAQPPRVSPGSGADALPATHHAALT